VSAIPASAMMPAATYIGMARAAPGDLRRVGRIVGG
jgi:hypothetical protein